MILVGPSYIMCNSTSVGMCSSSTMQKETQNNLQLQIQELHAIHQKEDELRSV